MGKRNSSLTRVQPIFDTLFRKDPSGASWLYKLLEMPKHGHQNANIKKPNSPIRKKAWGNKEKSLAPPVSLLSWLIRNLPITGIPKPDGSDDKTIKRIDIYNQESETIKEALSLIKPLMAPKKWFVLEGMSKPDAYIETDNIIIVIEGKRTEKGPTIGTTWMPGRHQMLRHIDAAYETRGDKQVYGFLIVEGNGGATSTLIPDKWKDASLATFSTSAINNSFPHRGTYERGEIMSCFLGVVTWQAVCQNLDIAWSSLPDTK